MSLRRDEKNGLLGGVCAGLGKSLNVDVSLMRFLFVLAFLFVGTGPLLYLILWLLLPTEDGE